MVTTSPTCHPASNETCQQLQTASLIPEVFSENGKSQVLSSVKE